MNEQELRSLVREAVERHLGRPQSTGAGLQSRATEALTPRPRATAVVAQGFSPVHSSHIILNLVPGSEVDDGMCVIEPAVRCNHCGFCQSYGH